MLIAWLATFLLLSYIFFQRHYLQLLVYVFFPFFSAFISNVDVYVSEQSDPAGIAIEKKRKKKETSTISAADVLRSFGRLNSCDWWPSKMAAKFCDLFAELDIAIASWCE